MLRKALLIILPAVLLLAVGCQFPGVGTPDDAEKEETRGTLDYLGVALAPQEDLTAVTKSFDAEETTIVVWKVNLANNDPNSRHKLTAEWYWHDGTLKWTEERDFSTGSDSTISITGGKGYSGVGGWQPGVYTIKFYLDGSPLAEEIFRVTGEVEEEQEPILLAGINFHDPDDVTEPVEVFPRAETTQVLWFAKLSVTDEAAGTHTVTADWLDPDGKPLWREERSVTVFEGDEAVSVGGGQGYEEPGNWAAGEYTLMLSVDGEQLGQARFSVGEVESEEEDGGEAKPTGLALYGLVFVDRDDYNTPRESFKKDDTAMIVWVVSLARESDEGTGDHVMTVEWYDPSEELRWTQDKEFTVEADEETKRVIGGRGYTETGWWDTGEWSVIFYLDGNFVALENFSVE